MQQLLMNLRVRPARVVVLIDRLARPHQFVHVLRFFSQLWGSRYCLVIPVDADTPDALTPFRLGELRPDFVYGVSIDEAKFAHGEIPESLTLGALLEHWADRAILTRSWQLGPCSQCRQTWFVEELSIQQPILCRNCGHRMLLPERPCIAYSLASPVKRAMDEGVVPVVLAGRFLRNMTNRGSSGYRASNSSAATTVAMRTSSPVATAIWRSLSARRLMRFQT